MNKLTDWVHKYYLNHKNSIFFLASFWVVYIFINIGLYTTTLTSYKDLLRVLINYPLWGLFVFVPNIFILKHFLFKKKFLLAVSGNILILLLFLAIRYLLNYKFFPSWGVMTPYDGQPFNPSLFLGDSGYVFLHNTMLAYGYGFAKHAIELEIRERKLTEANAKLQHQKDMTQIAFLQAQINPHFLYNTLNFIYSEAIMVSDSVAESIMTLSNIMRYTLTETGKDTLVSLYSEINHIKNYLKLQKMRFSNELYLDLTIEGEENINHLEILPLVLISFIENIFKHGDIHDPKNPAKIIMIVEENSLFLSIYNRKNKGPKEHTSGVGMNNIRTRMDILYGDKYNVNIFIDTEDEFALEFTISDMEEAFRNLKKYKLINR